MNCKKEAEKFAEPPVVLMVPGGSSSGFRKTALNFKSNNSILDSFFASKLTKVKPRRVCLVSFSAGWAWSTEVLRAKKDIDRVDSTIVMDGIHTSNLNAWYSYAEKAAVGGLDSPKLWLAHTQIKPKYVSTKTTNTKIIDHARSTVSNSELLTIPAYVWDVTLESPISVYSKIERPKTKIYHTDPLGSFESIGNVARFEYEGNRAQDHIYNAHYVQPRFWNWLRDLWSNPKSGIFWE